MTREKVAAKRRETQRPHEQLRVNLGRSLGRSLEKREVIILRDDLGPVVSRFLKEAHW